MTHVLVLPECRAGRRRCGGAGRGADSGPAWARVGLGGAGDARTALEGVESEHLQPLEPAVKAINAQFDVILSALPGNRIEGGDRRREEAAMILGG